MRPAHAHTTPTSRWKRSSSPPWSRWAPLCWRRDDRNSPTKENTMTVHQPALEALGDHDYLLRFQQDEDTVCVRVHAAPAVVAQIAAEEQRVVEATAAYLIAVKAPTTCPSRST